MARGSTWWIFAVASIFAMSPAVGAQEVLIQSLYAKTFELYHSSRHEEALPYAAELCRTSNVVLASVEPRDEELLLRLATGYEDKGQYELSLDMYKAALDVSEEIHGEEHPHISDILVNIADLYVLQRKECIAEVVFERALNIRTKALGENHPDVLLLRERISKFKARCPDR
jgi:tetratricopeptide (TPR) repeat protein